MASPPQWATNANFGAGANVWNSQPNKVLPPGGVIAEGFDPQSPLPAEWLNYYINAYGVWLLGIIGATYSLKALQIDGVGGNVVAPSAAQLSVGQSALANTPLAIFHDQLGNNRWVIDHNGLPTGGRVSQFREEWPYIVNPLSPPQTDVVWSGTPWTYNVATGGSIVVSSPSASYDARYLTLTPPSSLATGTSLWGPLLFVSNIAGQSVVFEFEVGMNAAAAGAASKTDCWFGLQDGADAPDTDQNVIILHKLSTAANYEAYSLVAGVLHTTTTTTPPTVGTFPTDRIRIEVQGSASAYAAYQARLFVNEVLITTIVAANLPGAVALRPVFSIEPILGAPVGSPLAYVGPLTITWNRFASGPAL